MLVATNLKLCFTWSRQMEPIEAGILPIGELRFAISKKIEDPMEHPT